MYDLPGRKTIYELSMMATIYGLPGSKTTLWLIKKGDDNNDYDYM